MNGPCDSGDHIRDHGADHDVHRGHVNAPANETNHGPGDNNDHGDLGHLSGDLGHLYRVGFLSCLDFFPCFFHFFLRRSCCFHTHNHHDPYFLSCSSFSFGRSSRQMMTCFGQTMTCSD